MRSNLLVENVYTELKKRILSGEYLPGIHLIEADLTIEYKVSRVTMRDALRRLVADELVNLVPNKGIWVRQLSYRDVLELHTVRESLEALAARLLAEMPVKNLDDLQQIYLEDFTHRDLIHHKEINNRFHKTLISMTGNLILVKTLERLNPMILSHQFLLHMRDEDIISSRNGHEEILEAICIGDGDKAELAMRQHLKSGLKFVLTCFPNEPR